LGEHASMCLCEHCITKLVSRFKGIAREKLGVPTGGPFKPEAIPDQDVK
jgi:hypothetical protein